MKSFLPKAFYRIKIGLQLSLVLPVILLSFQNLSAQNGAPCYQPITGFGKTVTPVQGGLLCLGCSSVANINNITDADPNNFATITSINILTANGVSVADTVNTYPGGWHAGFTVGIGNNALNATVLTSLSVETWNNGVLQQASTAATGLQVTLAGEASGKLFLNFVTTFPFDEVRFVFTAPAAVLNTFNIYNAMAFDPNCGITDGNAICMDQIAGPATSVSNNMGLLNAVAYLINPAAINDGNKLTAATLQLPAGVSLLSNPPYVGVIEHQIIHPAGNRAGFVIGYPSNLLSADVLNAISVRTYLHGFLQDTADFANGTGLLDVGALADAAGLKEISINTTLPFNEVRMFVRQSASVNVGNIDIYYAFESGAACTDCKVVLSSGAAAPNTGAINAVRTGTMGTICLGQSLTNTANVVTPSTTDYATFTPAILSLGCGARISVTNDGTDYPAGTFAGFHISKQGGLVDLALLNAITINVYKDGGAVAVASSNGSALLTLGLLNGAGGISSIGFKPSVAFDEVQIQFNSGLINVALGGTYRIYNAFITRDDDIDGVPDCIEICGASNDAIDTDGDGIPDACDVCTLLNAKSSAADTDGDGIFNACDADSDNDGIADVNEDISLDGNPTNDDADGDGIPNYLDLDSDNDGIPDLDESGLSAAAIAALDADNNGVIDNAVPKGLNGMADAIETNGNADAAINYALANTDGDGSYNFVDLDADNDGINDVTESGYVVTDANMDGMVDGPDTDGDGIMNSADGSPVRGAALVAAPRNSDNDPIPDYLDLDSDNDLTSDLAESGASFVDANMDGVVDGPDADGDGIMDSVDGNDLAFGDQGGIPALDTDNDGAPDYRDVDKNNDGTKDIVDIGLGWTDPNGDGSVDNPSDPDGDGIPNNYGVDANPGIFGGLGTSTVFYVKTLLQGGLINPSDLLMRDDLRQLGLIPMSQPYNSGVSPRFTTYDSGNETTTAAVLSANAGTGDAIVDWVFIEIRSGANPLTVVRTVSGLLQRDGDIVATDGNKLGVILPTGNYYLSVKHRNHLGIMTAVASIAAHSTSTVNFTDGSAPVYGGAAAMVQLQPNRYAQFGGDVNSDGQVYYVAPGNDRDALLAILGGDSFGYLGDYNYGDLNLDGQTYFVAPDNDRDWLLFNPMGGDEFNYIQESLPQ